MKCRICNNATQHAFYSVVLNRHEAEYRICQHCGYLYVTNPHWLDEAYTSAIASSDTGLVMRNIAISCKLASLLYWGLHERGTGIYLDAAGGYGMLTRLMRDFGFNFYWQDKYCSNLLANGFSYDRSMGACRAATAFEVLEHLEDPVGFLNEIRQQTQASTFILSTELYNGLTPAPKTWEYYSFPTGQHIGFFQRKTLEFLGKKMSLHLASANGIHVLSTQHWSEYKLGIYTGRWLPKLAPIWTRRQLGTKTLSDSINILKATRTIL